MGGAEHRNRRKGRIPTWCRATYRHTCAAANAGGGFHGTHGTCCTVLMIMMLGH